MMDYKAEIIVKEDPDKIYKCLLPGKVTRKRSTLNIKKGRGGLLLSIDAKDAVAFRATLNAVSQVLAVYHKMKKIRGAKNDKGN